MRKLPRWPSLLLRAAAIGVASNIAVAWGIAAFLNPLDGFERPLSIERSAPGPGANAIVVDVCAFYRTGVVAAFAQHHRADRAQSAFDRFSAPTDNRRPGSLADPQLDWILSRPSRAVVPAEDFIAGYRSTVASGWPFLSVYADLRDTVVARAAVVDGSGTPIGPIRLSLPKRTPPTGPQGFRSTYGRTRPTWPNPSGFPAELCDRVLPATPLLLGTALNTLFYALGWLVLTAGPRAVVRFRRRRCGLCRSCGHPRAALRICPECGAD